LALTGFRYTFLPPRVSSAEYRVSGWLCSRAGGWSHVEALSQADVASWLWLREAASDWASQTGLVVALWVGEAQAEGASWVGVVEVLAVASAVP